jgi:hypothetical protein
MKKIRIIHPNFLNSLKYLIFKKMNLKMKPMNNQLTEEMLNNIFFGKRTNSLPLLKEQMNNKKRV